MSRAELAPTTAMTAARAVATVTASHRELLMFAPLECEVHELLHYRRIEEEQGSDEEGGGPHRVAPRRPERRRQVPGRLEEEREHASDHDGPQQHRGSERHHRREQL